MEPGHSRQIELLFPVHHPTTHDAVSTFHWDARLPVHLPPDCETRRPRRQYIHVRPAQNHICTVLGNYIGKGTAFPAATARPTTVPQDCKTWLRTWRYDPAYTRCPAIGSYCYRKGRANNYVSRRQLTWRNNSLPGKARILPHRYNNHDQSWFAIRTRSRSLFQLRHPRFNILPAASNRRASEEENLYIAQLFCCQVPRAYTDRHFGPRCPCTGLAGLLFNYCKHSRIHPKVCGYYWKWKLPASIRQLKAAGVQHEWSSRAIQYVLGVALLLPSLQTHFHVPFTYLLLRYQSTMYKNSSSSIAITTMFTTNACKLILARICNVTNKEDLLLLLVLHFLLMMMMIDMVVNRL